MGDIYIGFNAAVSGFYRSLMQDGEKKRFEFTVTATAPLKRFINPLGNDFMQANLEGIVTMEGVCKDAEIAGGKLVLDLIGKPHLTYSFNFAGAGTECSYSGKKEISINSPLASMPVLFGSIECSRFGMIQDICGTVCYLEMEDLPSFLLSFIQNIRVK